MSDFSRNGGYVGIEPGMVGSGRVCWRAIRMDEVLNALGFFPSQPFMSNDPGSGHSNGNSHCEENGGNNGQLDLLSIILIPSFISCYLA